MGQHEDGNALINFLMRLKNETNYSKYHPALYFSGNESVEYYYDYYPTSFGLAIFTTEPDNVSPGYSPYALRFIKTGAIVACSVDENLSENISLATSEDDVTTLESEWLAFCYNLFNSAKLGTNNVGIPYTKIRINVGGNWLTVVDVVSIDEETSSFVIKTDLIGLSNDGTPNNKLHVTSFGNIEQISINAVDYHRLYTSTVVKETDGLAECMEAYFTSYKLVTENWWISPKDITKNVLKTGYFKGDRVKVKCVDSTSGETTVRYFISKVDHNVDDIYSLNKEGISVLSSKWLEFDLDTNEPIV